MKKAFKIIGIILIVLWFGGNLALYLLLNEMLISNTSKKYINNIPEKLYLQESVKEGDTLQLMDFELRFPFYKDDIKYVIPMFMNRKLSNVIVRLDEYEHVHFSSYFEITEEMQKENTFKYNLENVEEEKETFSDKFWDAIYSVTHANYGEPFYEMFRKAQYSSMNNFSWWNLPQNIRLGNFLILKAIESGNADEINLFDVETQHVKGILSDKITNDSGLSINDFYFKLDNISYSIGILAKINGITDMQVNNIISSINQVSDKEKSYNRLRSLFKNKGTTKYPEELLILSLMSFEGTSVERLNELLQIMIDKSYPSYIIEEVKKEIRFLESR